MTALLQRLAHELKVSLRVTPYSASGGFPRVHTEFQKFLRDLASNRIQTPDAIILVTDSNCVGQPARKKRFRPAIDRFPNLDSIIHFAIPDPHIERWMLLDANAFKAVFERGCTLPTIKCDKDEYKRLLLNEIRLAGIEPPLGGEEYVTDIVAAMDLNRAAQSEPSFGAAYSTLRSLLVRHAP
jgi:hypothetical protein